MESKTVWNALDASPETATESPLEEGVFLYPANSVETEPPKFNSEKQVCKWDGAEWVVSDKPKIIELVPPPIPDPPAAIEPATNPKPVDEEEDTAEPHIETYVDKRRSEYGHYGQQLEFITENGLEAWQERVKEIKKKYPKE